MSLFIYYSNFLFCTAIFKIPIYFISCFFLIVKLFLSKKVTYRSNDIYIFYAICVLVVISFLHCLIANINIVGEIKQLIIRCFYLINFLLIFDYFRNKSIISIDWIVKQSTIIMLGYAIYEFIAGIYSFPTLRNILITNPSFRSETLKPIAGKFGELIRLSIFWTEPSYAAITIGFIFVYSLAYQLPKKYLFMLVLAGILTTSRSLVVPCIITLAIYFFKSKVRYSLKVKNTNIELIVLFLVILVAHIYFINKSLAGSLFDMSFISRNNSIIIGYKIFFDHWIIGTGMNSFVDNYSRYSTSLISYIDANVPLSVLSNYLQSMGVFGLLFLFSIFAYITCSNLEHYVKLQLVGYLVSFGLFSVDIFYLPVTYLFIAIFISRSRIDL